MGIIFVNDHSFIHSADVLLGSVKSLQKTVIVPGLFCFFKVYVRRGVCRDCPEGKEWMHIPCHNMGVINIACGPTGLVWAITWDGHAIVRTHVSRDAVYGEGLLLLLLVALLS